MIPASQPATSQTGPGAGRPAKLYRRSEREVGVSVPARRYELAGQLLADAVEESDSTGEPVRAVLFRKAAELGERLGAEAAAGVVDLLERHGFEPRREGDTVVLGNRPFHLLARKHVETVCGMNLHLLRGALATSGDTGYEACLSPAPGRCRVVLEPAS
ncbi:hypothetical protein ACFW19_15055 [Streptomyces nigra]|uniref:hypothetical protein n=1 Tax=Streptomyces nigra TaxID=1827580 RepID=UPI0036865743